MKHIKKILPALFIALLGMNSTFAGAAEMPAGSFPGTSSEILSPTEAPYIPAVDIDLGDYEAEMYVGKTQVLMITVLPTDATDQNITYHSSDTNVATVNMMGRITARSEGEVEISVSAGGITRRFTLKVTTEPETSESSQPHVAVKDIEISNFKETIKVDETVDITAAVLPKDATKPDISYSSTNTGVATINSSGQIKGVSAGKATIIAETEEFIKYMSLTVKLATQNIEINETYLVLNEEESFQLSVKILPANADQSITYKSTSSDVVSVSESGLIKALKPGSSSIIISTWDASKIVNIIVNEPTPENAENPGESQQMAVAESSDQAQFVKWIAALPEDGELNLEGAICPVVESDVLKELYGTRKTLVIHHADYIMRIAGADIKNIDHALSTGLSLSTSDNGLEFEMNGGKKLPGKIQIQLLNQKDYSRLYLYSEIKDNYEEINTLKPGNQFIVDANGRYILSDKKIANSTIPWLIILIVVCVIGIGLGTAYVSVKKKHWFW